jgi:hypothetical protein
MQFQRLNTKAVIMCVLGAKNPFMILHLGVFSFSRFIVAIFIYLPGLDAQLLEVQIFNASSFYV